ncbi:hypothetical protein vBPpSSYP_120 [Pseudomonas phage vB_PpS_SYP]|nr:hypothetical protein vBPpSSYP_120 [Pseudomonas phage vB_PpS_SYP]
MRFQIPIGDWSDDGHGKCKYFTCISNGEIEDVRHAFFALNRILGFDFDDMCSEYEDSKFKEHEIDALYKHNLIDADDAEYFADGNGVEVEQFVEILVKGLNLANPKLNVELTQDERLPRLNGWHPESNQRIGQLGYGLFWC